MASIIEILRAINMEADGAASKVESLHRANRGLIDDARELSSIVSAPAPATFAPPDPRSAPGPFSPIVGVDGSTIGGRRTSTSTSSRGGGDGSSGAGSGGGGIGGQRTRADILYNLEGGSMPGEWVRAHCTPIRLRVPLRTGSAAIPGDISNFKEVNAWQCPAPWGTFIEDESVLSSMSASSSGGSGTSAPTLRSKPLIGRGISNSTITPGEHRSGPTDFFTPESTAGGLQSSGQGFSAPGVESRLDRLIKNQEDAIRGDGGAGLRAGGLL